MIGATKPVIRIPATGGAGQEGIIERAAMATPARIVLVCILLGLVGER